MTKEAKAARAFAAKWKGHGEEKQESQRFWLELLEKVLGAEHVMDLVRFEERVRLSHTSFIDIMVPATHTMIEQKSAKKELDEPIRQADGTKLTPFQQAKRYSAELPYSERPRWIVVCNFRQFDIYDMERPNDAPTRVELENLEKDWTCLRFITDTKSTRIQKEMELSRAAGELVGKIYDALLPCYGAEPSAQDAEDLNKLIVRLVFCFYAEDAGLFGKHDMFHDYMEGFAPKHFRRGLMDLFAVFDQKPEERDRFLDEDMAAFPYVNGSLFTEEVPVPPISESVRQLILDEGCGFDWSNISPTIFGAIFESTLNPATRRAGGMHYTSPENIHKVIDPLFLDGYRAQFETAMQEKQLGKRMQKLKELQKELARGQYFDPACGSGNFLTESYLSLRRLENDILRELIKNQKADKGGGNIALDFAFEDVAENAVQVSIQQFYGIEVNDFAVAVAKTALWIAESQMFQETQEILSSEAEFLPLSTNGNIREGNALRIAWEEVLPPADNVRIMGNPPFVGARLMSAEQKADMRNAFPEWNNLGNLDYVASWYIKAAWYMKGTAIHAAFVSTKSITQGDQATILWKPLCNEGVHINFAYRSFRWENEAKKKAQVFCVIVGFSYVDDKNKFLDNGGVKASAERINPYLVDAPDIFVESRTMPLCDVQEIGIGNKPIDGGHYLFQKDEMEAFLKVEPAAKMYFRPWFGTQEFINRAPRYCLWLGDCAPKQLLSMPHCLERVKAVQAFRQASKSAGTRKLAEKPTRFHVENMPKGNYIVIPEVSSDKRRYIPMGYMDDRVLCSNKLRLMPNATLYDFGILESNVHMAWMRTVCCRMGTGYDYSINIVYNNFPWPSPTPAQRAKIEATAQGILDARAKYPESTFADMYGEGMILYPELLEAHRKNDIAVMEAYGFWGKFNDEPSCVAALMRRYQALCVKE